MTLQQDEEFLGPQQHRFPPAILPSVQDMEPQAIVLEKMREQDVRARALKRPQELVSTAVGEHQLAKDKVKLMPFQEGQGCGAVFCE